MGLSKKVIKCTINLTSKPSLACDLWIWQTVPSDLGEYAGHFLRIVNEKNLVIEANEGNWGFGWEPKGGWWDTLAFYPNPPPKVPFEKRPILLLHDVPFDFINQVIAGQVISRVDRGFIPTPPYFLGWKMWT
jgi:hypothetical protein